MNFIPYLKSKDINMELNELYDLMSEELSDIIMGQLTYEGLAIKWEYDSFNVDFDEYETDLEYLHRIYEEDLETMKDIINLDGHHFSDPTIEDTYISFYIEQ